MVDGQEQYVNMMGRTAANVAPNRLGPSFPIYPPVRQLVKCGKSTGPVTSVKVQQYDGTRFRDREDAYAFEPNSMVLSPGGTYRARLVGAYAGLPLYVVGLACCVPPSSSSSSASEFVSVSESASASPGESMSPFPLPSAEGESPGVSGSPSSSSSSSLSSPVSASPSPSSSSSVVPSSSESSSPSGGVIVPCCPNPLPPVLVATFINGTGGCVCFNGLSINMTVNLMQVWESGPFTICGKDNVTATVSCQGLAPFTNWLWVTGVCPTNYFQSSYQCDPLIVIFPDMPVSDPGCCDGTITVVLTEP